MNQKTVKSLKINSPYSAVLTREQFLFYETRTTAKLLQEGLTKKKSLTVLSMKISSNILRRKVSAGWQLYAAAG